MCEPKTNISFDFKKVSALCPPYYFYIAGGKGRITVAGLQITCVYE